MEGMIYGTVEQRLFQILSRHSSTPSERSACLILTTAPTADDAQIVYENRNRRWEEMWEANNVLDETGALRESLCTC